jgi:hypothetical protein
MEQTAFPFPTSMPEIQYKTNAKVLDAQYRQELLYRAEVLGVGLVHVHSKHTNKGGLTIAYKKCSDHKSGYMVEIAVNVCSESDNFSKKQGVVGALEKFFASTTIDLPLLKDNNEEDLSYVIKRIFSIAYAMM